MSRRSFKVALGSTLGVVAFGVLVNGCLSAPAYQGPKSDHFDGERFYNQAQSSSRGFTDLLKWKLQGTQKKWPKWVDISAPDLPPKAMQSGFRITFINHATTLIQLKEANILTDPIWSKRAGPFSWAGAARHKAPGVGFDYLPKIDVVLISHNHYDHLDIETLKRLQARFDPLFIAGLGTKGLLVENGIRNVLDLDWWQAHVVKGLTVTFTPVQHWSARGIGDRNVNLWGGFFVQGEQRSVYFAGDTGADGGHFQSVRERLGAPDIALLPIGAYEPRWFMKPQHMNPAEAVTAHKTLGAKRSMGVHWGTFQLTDEGIGDPPADLARALADQNVAKRAFLVLENGQYFDTL